MKVVLEKSWKMFKFGLENCIAYIAKLESAQGWIAQPAAARGGRVMGRGGIGTVSYTHLTLPTIYSV